LRKDFPLTASFSVVHSYAILTPLQGYTEIRYDEERKRIVYEPLQLTQAFRFVHLPYSAFLLLNHPCHSNFESLSPWEQVGDGTKPIRPAELKPVPPPEAPSN